MYFTYFPLNISNNFSYFQKKIVVHRKFFFQIFILTYIFAQCMCDVWV